MSIVAEGMLQPSRTGRDARVHTMGLSAKRVSGADWDAIIGGFDEVCQEQMYAFAVVRWPGVDQEPLIFQDGSEVVGSQRPALWQDGHGHKGAPSRLTRPPSPARGHRGATRASTSRAR